MWKAQGILSGPRHLSAAGFAFDGMDQWEKAQQDLIKAGKHHLVYEVFSTNKTSMAQANKTKRHHPGFPLSGRDLESPALGQFQEALL